MSAKGIAYRSTRVYITTGRGHGAPPIGGCRERHKEMTAKPWPVVPHFEDATTVEPPLVLRLPAKVALSSSGIGNSAAMLADIGDEE